eukprot:SAG22_NODE_3404_length_1731_cov_3.185662_3_plen_96_part_01
MRIPDGQAACRRVLVLANWTRRAKTIKNTASANQQRSVAELNRLVGSLQRELRGQTSFAAVLQRDILALDPSYELPARDDGAAAGAAGAAGAGEAA